VETHYLRSGVVSRVSALSFVLFFADGKKTDARALHFEHMA